MKLVFTLLLLVHGLIHLMGFAKAFGVAELTQLVQPISKAMGLVWLLAAVLLGVTAAALFVLPRWWWVVGVLALAASQTAIASSWSDAKFGSLANLILLVGVLYGVSSQGPWSFRAEYERAVSQQLARTGETPIVTDADLAHLPDAVQRYLRIAGAVGQPQVKNFRARFRGEIRSGPDARWMPFTAEQHNFYDEPSRLFSMQASFLAIPIEALHLYVGPSATMRVKVASLIQVADAKGPEMDQAETVTLLNDMCVLAPAALLTPQIRWEAVDARTTKASFTNAGHTISAELSFNEEGELVDFQSDDRYVSSSDGKVFTKTRWSTPVSNYRSFGPRRVSTRGEARWHPAEGGFAYGRFELEELEYNVQQR